LQNAFFIESQVEKMFKIIRDTPTLISFSKRSSLDVPLDLPNAIRGEFNQFLEQHIAEIVTKIREEREKDQQEEERKQTPNQSVNSYEFAQLRQLSMQEEVKYSEI
jgi:hypothetical protein